MKFYDNKIVKKIREARRKGESIRDLETRFKVSNTTVSRWVRDIPSKERLYLKSREEEEKNKNKFKGLVAKIKLDEVNSKILAAMLYWCEGSKYPSTSCVSFSNSDCDLVKSFLELIRLGFDLDESKFRVHLQLHTTHNKTVITRFWSELLNIPKEKFYKPTITKPTRRMKRIDYKGTCTVRYYDVKLLFQLIGLYQEFANKWRGTQVAEGGSLLNS